MGKISIIAQREFKERVHKKSFIITTILMPLLFVAIMVIPIIMATTENDHRQLQVLVVDDSGFVAENLTPNGDITFVPSDKTLEQLQSETLPIFGILVIGEDVVSNPRNVQLYTYQPSTLTIELSIAKQIENIIEDNKLKSYNIDNLQQILNEINTPVSLQVKQIGSDGESKESSSILSIAAAYIFGFMTYMFIVIYGGMVMAGVIEEKNNRVLEIMVSSVKPFQLMMGKILGIASVAITQLAIWVVFIVIVGGGAISLFAGDVLDAADAVKNGMPANGIDMNMAAIVNTLTDPLYLFRMVGSFLLFFIGGYLLYSAMYAAVGSSVDNSKDAYNLQMPITIPMLMSLFVMMGGLQAPDSSMSFWFSIIPFTSPVVMMSRLPYGVPTWQIVLSLALLYATFVGMVWVAGKIYRVGIFMYGKKPTFKELYKWTKYK